MKSFQKLIFPFSGHVMDAPRVVRDQRDLVPGINDFGGELLERRRCAVPQMDVVTSVMYTSSAFLERGVKTFE